MSDRKTAVTSPYVIGTAPFRPGDEADFGGKFAEQPNDLNRPDPTKCQAEDTVKHASGLVSVLNDDHEAEGEWIPDISVEKLIVGLEYMMEQQDLYSFHCLYKIMLWVLLLIR